MYYQSKVKKKLYFDDNPGSATYRSSVAKKYHEIQNLNVILMFQVCMYIV